METTKGGGMEVWQKKRNGAALARARACFKGLRAEEEGKQYLSAKGLALSGKAGVGLP